MILMEMMLEVVIGVLVMEVDKVADDVSDMDVTLVGLAVTLMMISPSPLDASQLSHNPTSAAPFLFLS